MTEAVLDPRAAASLAQRPAARPDRSVWVAASAGTGKTKVLTDRVLSLMLHGTQPARILCLTFTKAAAAEMSNRLADSLARWATFTEEQLTEDLAKLLDDPADAAIRARARELFARVLDAPGGMKILTIHAFCQSLLGRFPLEARIAPHFQVLDERSAAEMLLEAREEVLAGPGADPGAGSGDQENPAVAEVAVYAQEQSFQELMSEVIRERTRLRRLIVEHRGVDGLRAAIFQALEVDEADSLDDVIAAACADDSFDQMGLRLVAEALVGGTAAEAGKSRLLRDWLDADLAERVLRFDAYAGLYLTKDETTRARLLTKAAAEAVSGALEVMAAEAERLLAARARLNRLRVARATAGLVALGTDILDAYERRKQARALLDYDDLILAARGLLEGDGAAAWVLFKLDGGLDHILIDEAQDTNPEQWRVIRALAGEFFVGAGARDDAREGPRTVFAVGDAKQSIYSFQRADPGAFARMRAHFDSRAENIGQRLEKVELSHSFRSVSAVLDAVDAVFAQAAAQDGVLFDEDAMTHRAVRAGQAGLVELWPPAEPAEAAQPAPWAPPLAQPAGPPPRARLAKLIAARIARWTVADPPAGETLRDGEAWLESRDRRLTPGDILVLVRRRNEFVEELVRELKRGGVPVAGLDRMVLPDQLAVMDLVALGRVLLLPEDDLTLATVLKGPLVGLSEEQLFTLAYDRGGSLWDSLTRQARVAGADPAFRAAREHLGALLARADFVPPYELYSEVLTRDWGRGSRGRAALLARLGPEAADPIEEFLSLALAYEREHAPSLEGFLHWIEVGKQEVKRDMEHGQDAVRVMTVHGAKGLQAPVVILPDTMQPPKPRGGLFWTGEQDGERGGELPLWPLRKGYDDELVAAARARAKEVQDQEYRRLLYVALTRAEDRLIVCGWRGAHAAPADCWYNLVAAALATDTTAAAEPVDFDFASEVADGWAGPGWRLRSAQTADPETDREGSAAARVAAAALPDWTQTPPPPEAVPPRPLAPSRPSGEEPPVRSPLGPDEGRRFKRGRLVHRLLQNLPDLAPGARAAAAARFLASPAHDLSAEERAEIAAATLSVLDDPAFAALFGPDSRAEVPIVGLIDSGDGPQAVSGQVDRLVVGADSVLVVDYKTNRPAPRDEAGVAPVYLRQMAAYHAVLSEIYPDRRIDCALLWTDGPHLMQLSPARLNLQAS